ncbi:MULTISPECIES: class I adenylate-forming enzyme family protein [unclassified Roseitalea]|uniref:class I adenylate-forming enzyme family protein n=1 Tax=unclassified Roseitalea TaxID=2639107 RepID=UPI00273F2D92|nr:MULTISPECIES: class I adenylate-forming enzyme family protein [unclassified Roseitalea]
MTDTVATERLRSEPRVGGIVPRAIALAYWRALGAPVGRVARALHADPADIAAALAQPVEPALSGLHAVPRSAVPWAARTANTLIEQGLSRPQDGQLVFVAGEGALNAGEVAGLVGRICAGLGARGIGKGDLVAVDASQRLESYLVALATLLSGAVLVRLGDTVGPEPLRAMVRAAPARISFSDRFAQIGPMEQTGARIALGDEGPAESFAEFLDRCPEPAAEWRDHLPAVAPDDAAFVGFTSGSTGVPKPMLTSHEAIFRSTEIARRVFAFDATDIFCTATDFTALSAFRSLVTLPLACGGRVVIPSPEARQSPLALALECERYGVTRLTAVPGVIRAFNKAGARLDRDRLGALRTVFSGSGVLDRTTAESFGERFSIPVIDYYGGREFATAAYADAEGERTMSAGGGFVHDCAVLIVDENGVPARPGAVGEIVVHSDSMTLTDLASIRRAGRWAGWHFTGDLGRFLPDGRLEIVGRIKDVIKSPDGTLVSPAEVEGALNGLGWVADAAAFSFTDAAGIERVGAAVALLAGAVPPADPQAEARRAVEAVLGPHKTPARVLVCAALPQVGRGKPDKRRLRQMMAEGSADNGAGSRNC